MCVTKVGWTTHAQTCSTLPFYPSLAAHLCDHLHKMVTSEERKIWPLHDTS